MAGVGTIAAAVAVLIAIAVGWGAISGALDTGWSLDGWLVIEIAFVGLVALFIAMRRRALRRP